MALKVLFVVREIESAEPVGLLYVAASLQQAGHECLLTGTRGTDVEDQVERFRPHVLAFGSTTGLHKYYLGLAAHLKSTHPEMITFMGGPHATHFPEVIFTPGIDVICRGEGEDAAVEFCDALESGDDYRHIPDLWVKHEGQI
ncbi:MAG: cobalamin-dependent protein [Planctomycetota bacterium]|jgi:radical SAM superfamily enzyme YgiQ (UPF0313 family)|nr:cobalamin-dependent protein [Planctomycetota bacterium]